MKRLRLIGMITAVAVAGSCIALLLTWRPTIAAIERPQITSFDRGLVTRGAELAAIGDCAVCHTASGDKPFTGGRALVTPFGTLYTTNLTPDVETGIGQWSLAAFQRAIRDGVGRRGEHLYPALPYEHYTKLTDEDVEALYVFFMTRGSVQAPTPENALHFPFGFRPLLAGWKWVSFDRTPYRADPRHSDEWNRGGYLVETLAHCGGCHTPRNLIGAERFSRSFEGGVAEGWTAPPLDASNPNAARWTPQALFAYLRDGVATGNAMAGGPMRSVTHSLADVPEEEVRDMASYLADRFDHPLVARPAPSRSNATDFEGIDHIADAALAHPVGANVFAGACMVCHEPRSPMSLVGRPDLASLTAIKSSDPRNAIIAILQGIREAGRNDRPYMPAFDGVLDDSKIAEVAAYLRLRFTDEPAWTDLPRTVAFVRKDSEQ